MRPSAADLFNLAETEHATLFDGLEYPWDVLKHLGQYLAARFNPIQLHKCIGKSFIGEKVQLGEGTVVEEGAMVLGPAIIGRNCQIRHNAYIRENVIVGDGCVVGNACEVKNSLLFNLVQVPHFNYVGDSVLGFKAHLGAGVILSNVKLDRKNIFVDVEGVPTDTGLRKFGALVGDGTEVGCNSVINPGSILGRDCILYPTVAWRGILPRNSIVKLQPSIEVVTRRPRGE